MSGSDTKPRKGIYAEDRAPLPQLDHPDGCTGYHTEKGKIPAPGDRDGPSLVVGDGCCGGNSMPRAKFEGSTLAPSIYLPKKK